MRGATRSSGCCVHAGHGGRQRLRREPQRACGRDCSRSRVGQSVLDDVRTVSWPTGYATDLLGLLNALALVVELGPAQADLLDRVMAGPSITAEEGGRAVR